MSASMIMVAPAPIAKPLTAQMMGLSRGGRLGVPASPSRGRSLQVGADAKALLAGRAEHRDPVVLLLEALPRRIQASTSSLLIALRASGRLMVMRAMPSRDSYRMTLMLQVSPSGSMRRGVSGRVARASAAAMPVAVTNSGLMSSSRNRRPSPPPGAQAPMASAIRFEVGGGATRKPARARLFSRPSRAFRGPPGATGAGISCTSAMVRPARRRRPPSPSRAEIGVVLDAEDEFGVGAEHPVTKAVNRIDARLAAASIMAAQASRTALAERPGALRRCRSYWTMRALTPSRPTAAAQFAFRRTRHRVGGELPARDRDARPPPAGGAPPVR